jgi:hypothetical protein
VVLELLDHMRSMEVKTAERVSLTALGQSQALEGTTVSRPAETYAAVLLTPIIAKLRLKSRAFRLVW